MPALRYPIRGIFVRLLRLTRERLSAKSMAQSVRTADFFLHVFLPLPLATRHSTLPLRPRSIAHLVSSVMYHADRTRGNGDLTTEGDRYSSIGKGEFQPKIERTTRQRNEPKRVEQVKTVRGGYQSFHNCEHVSKVYKRSTIGLPMLASRRLELVKRI